jgi:hypothetical protein
MSEEECQEFYDEFHKMEPWVCKGRVNSLRQTIEGSLIKNPDAVDILDRATHSGCAWTEGFEYPDKPSEPCPTYTLQGTTGGPIDRMKEFMIPRVEFDPFDWISFEFPELPGPWPPIYTLVGGIIIGLIIGLIISPLIIPLLGLVP